jgi:hypothetical protein
MEPPDGMGLVLDAIYKMRYRVPVKLWKPNSMVEQWLHHQHVTEWVVALKVLELGEMIISH